MNKLFWLLASFLAIILAAPGFAQACTTDADCTPRGPGFECNPSNQCEWQPPIGIPKPEFGIEETYRMYDDPANRNPDPALTYTQNTEEGFYTHYIDNTAPGGCNDGSDGTASNPRCTIPRPSDLPEGSVVEVHGGPYADYRGWFNGTSDHPIFIRGIDEDNMPLLDVIAPGGSYVIFEYLDLDAPRGSFWPDRNSDKDFIALRHSEIHNTGWSGIALRENCRNIVIYNNHIHDLGEWDGPTEQDYCGVKIGGAPGNGGSYNLWIVDNHIHHNSGDAVAPTGYGKYYIYVGRNLMHHNRENAVDMKGGTHIIISQNTIYGYYPRNTSGGEAIRPNDEGALVNIWIIFNNIYDSGVGVEAGGVLKESLTGPYIIGNKIHDLVGQGAKKTAINGDVYSIVNNVIYNVEEGIRVTNLDGIVANNIVSNASVYHIEQDDEASDVDIYNNLLWQNGEDPITWGTGSCIDCIEEDPLFVDAAGGDFHLEPDSPAIDAGIESNVYQTFFGLYGIDISVDFDGNPIPVDGDGDGIAEWNIGAFEAEEPVGCITTELLLEYIDKWDQGSMTMPSLLGYIARWKTGEGCS